MSTLSDLRQGRGSPGEGHENPTGSRSETDQIPRVSVEMAEVLSLI